MTTRTRLTLEEFLAPPDTEPRFEFVRGDPEGSAQFRAHGFLTSRIISRLDRYLEESGEAVVVNGVRHLDRDDERATCLMSAVPLPPGCQVHRWR